MPAVQLYPGSFRIGTPVIAGTAGSVLFIDSNNQVAQANAGIFYDATNKRLGIGTATPAGSLELNPTSGNADIYLSTNGVNRGRLSGEGGGAVVLRSENFILFQTNGNTTQGRITSGGLFGINKTTPTERLNVVGNFVLDDGDVTPTKSYRFRTSGSALDFDFAGANMTISGYPNADYTGTQKVFMIMGSTFDFVTCYSNWEWKDRAGSNIQHSINGDGNVIFNQSSGTKTVTIKGSTDASLFVSDPANNRIGIGVAAPAEKLDVGGNLKVSGTGTFGGNVILGANSITMTGSLAATGARVTKGWFTDLESTNMPTVGGTAILTSLTAPQFTTIELGNATDTTLSRSAAGVLAVEGIVIPSISSTNTITNKRNTRRAPAVTQSATPAINTDVTDVAHITALAQAITSMTSSLTGTPVEGDMLRIDITDNGTARAITWGTSFESSGNVTLPTTTVISTRLDMVFVWNTVTSKWRIVGLA